MELFLFFNFCTPVHLESNMKSVCITNCLHEAWISEAAVIGIYTGYERCIVFLKTACFAVYNLMSWKHSFGWIYHSTNLFVCKIPFCKLIFSDNYFLQQIIQRFAIVDLSNFYFDIAKDRLYVGYVFLILQHPCS